jgi:hypothetical protein
MALTDKEIQSLKPRDKKYWYMKYHIGARPHEVMFGAYPAHDGPWFQKHGLNVANPGPAILVGSADAVSVVGFPFGLAGGGRFAIWATGFQATEPIADFGDLPVSLIDCRSRQGITRIANYGNAPNPLFSRGRRDAEPD